jgi:DNA-directed RNA polymerase specialized sigma subunit
VENPLADIDDIDKIADPAEQAKEIGRRLNAIPAWNTLLREKRQAVLKSMKDGGMSYAEIGRAVEMHRNRVQQIIEGRTGGGQGGKADES